MKQITEKYPVIIPARAGSKGIIGKNMIDFCGKPLVAWSIIQALNSACVSNVYVSTDGSDIAKVAEAHGAKVIWRPAEISTDTSSSEEAIIHAISMMDEQDALNTIIFLQATSPLRRKDEIDNACRAFLEGGFDSLFSMTVLEDYCLWKRNDDGLYSFSYDFKNRGRRQEREPLFLENGSIFIFKKDLMLQEKNRLVGKIGMYEMPFELSYQIDSEKDISLCEHFMKQCILKEEVSE